MDTIGLLERTCPTETVVGEPDISEFLLTNRRLPRIGDAIPPWRFRSWLLQYVILGHAGHPQCVDRWGYWRRTMERGALLGEPIPRINFVCEYGHEQAAYQEDLRKLAMKIEHSVCTSSGFAGLVDWLAFGLGTEKEPPAFDDRLNETLYREFNVGPMLTLPTDHLGTVLASTKARGWNRTGFFPSPMNVAMFMAEMTIIDGQREGADLRKQTVNDPCCGTARLLLAASNFSLRLSGADIDPLVIKITKINGALFAPWLTWPFPESFFEEPAAPTVFHF